ncbi:MAG TPA: 2-oxo acid dehydrogenase subunit E2 [Gemmataceae bacterium]|jgi:pyruvate dehydrogenase E2 component (dihydrolipoamide acetyltransferase)
MASEIKLQALKENVDTVEVNAVKVSAGDVVAKDQPLLEVQADKAALEVPSPMAGRVAKILVKVGDQINIGQVYCVIESNGEQAAAPPTAKSDPLPAPKKEPAPPVPQPVRPSAVQPLHKPQQPVIERPSPVPPPAQEKIVPAGPSTRRLARELGVDLRQVRGSGRHGRVVEEDIKEYVRQLASGTAMAAPAAGPGIQPPPLPNFEEWGPTEAQPLGAVRRATARQMNLAWSLIPHVTQHDLADITDLEAFRKQQSEGKGPKLTVTAFVLRACAVALREAPTFNASIDLANGKLVLKRYYHLGVAVDTESGLLVPVLRDVDKKHVRELAEELNALAQRARDRKLDASELKGGTFTVSNLGGIGGTAFTPIINWPEVAILGLSRSRLEPVVRGGQIVPRLMLPLSLSYDHRVIDGASAARFTRRLAELLENPLMMLL